MVFVGEPVSEIRTNIKSTIVKAEWKSSKMLGCLVGDDGGRDYSGYSLGKPH